MNLDPDGTQRLLRRVFHRPNESVYGGVERHGEPRPPTHHVPGLSRPDVYSRLLALLIMPAFTAVLCRLAALRVLTAFSGLSPFIMLPALSSLPTLPVLARAFNSYTLGSALWHSMLTDLLGVARFACSLCGFLGFAGATGQPE